MAVRTSFFGVTQLSGSDSEKFANQVTYGKPKREAAESLKTGKTLLASMNKNGYVILKASPGKHLKAVGARRIKLKAK